MQYWSQIRQNFIDSFEGTVVVLFLVFLCAFALPVLYYLFRERWSLWRGRHRVQQGFLAKGLSPEQWTFLEGAIESICPDSPKRISENLAAFHVWLDSLPGIQDPNAERDKLLEGLEDIVFGPGHSVFVPGSSRDFAVGTTVNLVSQGHNQTALPCTIVEVDEQGLTLRPRNKEKISFARPGDRASLFCPRPEAMYHAICPVRSTGQVGVRLLHAVHEDFTVRQLREFWRVDVEIPVQFRVIDLQQNLGKDLDSDEAAEMKTRMEALAVRGDGMLINLSGNGAALVSSMMVPVGRIINFDLPLGDRVMRRLDAEVLHLTRVRDSHRMHLIFRNLEPAERELIIRGLFLSYRQRVPEV